MNEKMKKMKDEAIVALSVLNEANVDNTRKGVVDALANILEHGSYEDGAEAIALFVQWFHADCEQRTYETNEK